MTKEETRMTDTPGKTYFTALKALSYVAIAAMLGGILYAAATVVRYWPAIAV